jgi:crotonobetainyl-CoA:carnitine CoA-transferase CaiB-like acyl-CoA transferase
MDHPRLGRIRQVAPPFTLGPAPGAIRLPPPLLGEQTDEILAELGYSPEEIAKFRAAGIV